MKWLTGISGVLITGILAFIVFVASPQELAQSCAENALTPIPTVTLTPKQEAHAIDLIEASPRELSAMEAAVVLTMGAHSTDLSPTSTVNPLTGQRPAVPITQALSETLTRLDMLDGWESAAPSVTAALLLEQPATSTAPAWETAYAALFNINEQAAGVADAVARTGSICGTALVVSLDPADLVFVDGYTSPLPGATITSRFGYRIHPVYGYRKLHSGVDLAYGADATCNRPILAAADGQVTYAGAMSGYGHVIMVTHDDGVQTRYAHMYAQGVLVATGQSVTAGQVIGLVGSDGTSTACHLHFETYLPNGQLVDPIALLPWLAGV